MSILYELVFFFIKNEDNLLKTKNSPTKCDIIYMRGKMINESKAR